MSVEWQPGDLALCVRDGFGPAPNGCERVPPLDTPVFIARVIMPRVGTKWRVADVHLYDSPEEGPLQYLRLLEQPSDKLFDARLFTKIDEHEADAEDRETIALMNGLRAPVVAA